MIGERGLEKVPSAHPGQVELLRETFHSVCPVGKGSEKLCQLNH